MGYASSTGKTVVETSAVPLEDVMQLYHRDSVCKAGVDLLAAATVGMGFFTTVSQNYERAEEAKKVIDEFNRETRLDELLCDMTRVLIACGNSFWLKITPESLSELVPMPINAVVEIKRSYVDTAVKIPYKVSSYKLHRDFSGETLKPEAVLHWRINAVDNAWGIGILQVLLHTLTVHGDKRPSYAWMKARLEQLMPKIFEKYAGPDVLVWLEKGKDEDVKKFEKAIRERPAEGQWLFYTRGQANVQPVMLDPRARFEAYVDHLINQFYLAVETPLPRLFSSPGFTEASANTAVELQKMLVAPLQRYVKRMVEQEIFNPVLKQAGYDPAKAEARLNWGVPEKPELKLEDLLSLAKISAETGVQYIRPEELRKNLSKFGVELWDGTDDFMKNKSMTQS